MAESSPELHVDLDSDQLLLLRRCPTSHQHAERH